MQGWLQNFVGPIVSAGELAMRIVEIIDRGEGGEVRLPAFARWVGVVGCLPVGVQRGIRWWSGIDEAMGDMKGLVGRHGEVEKNRSDARSDEDEDEDIHASNDEYELDQ